LGDIDVLSELKAKLESSEKKTAAKKAEKLQKDADAKLTKNDDEAPATEEPAAEADTTTTEE
jgi:hypothetical protein